ncbi:hypothetical protein Psta_0567 [Pirellula staleyi DSM 6068]|uniref:Uncharacterized protein n=1 Tax=Pirellula staleyi (strain ATCC 27377 / DSM 6068 / ICPB 4128) TaxID=530564 RepID=D2R4A6_PIRSD|nr:hypothetical protein Psta_0567 [Pirellula staleyi DSM 6068]
MKFVFEKFVETDMSFAARATVRQKTGQIGFNLGAINRFGIRDFGFLCFVFRSKSPCSWDGACKGKV